ncbi:ferrichrome outer membrane transporter [compost metagenome]
MRRTFVSLCLLHAVSPPAWAGSLNEAEPALVELQALSIDANAFDAERADGPVQGYRATRSASATRTDTSLHETSQSVSVVPRDVIETSIQAVSPIPC